MANYNPQDIYAVMNALMHELTGQDEQSVFDSVTFADAGAQVGTYPTENVLNALGIVIGKTLVATRPYKAKLALIQAANTGVYSHRVRKISIYSQDTQAAGDVNTQLFTNLADGYDNGVNLGQSVGTMWEQNQPKVLEMHFGETKVWDRCVTIYEYQLKYAFTDESSFGAFIDGIMTELANDIESTKEAFNKGAILSRIGMSVANGDILDGKINLTSKYNSTYGTNYTTAQLLSTYLESFLKFFVAEFKQVSDYMTERTIMYHDPVEDTDDDITYNILRHTPKADQRVLLYSPIFNQARANVLPDIFNPSYLDMSNYEGVNGWQIIGDPSVELTAKNENGVTVNVSIPVVLGMIFDKDAVMIDYQLDSVDSTPVEARKKYRNLWYHVHRNAIVDPTENCCVFYMADSNVVETPPSAD